MSQEDRFPPPAEQPCANHPNRSTLVTCSSCGKPLCPDCMVFSAVGIKCKECARLPRSARVTLKPGKFALAAAAGLGTAIGLGFAYYYILGSLRFFFVFIFVSAGIGYLVGEAVSRVSGPVPRLADSGHRRRLHSDRISPPSLHGGGHQLRRQLGDGGLRLRRPRHHQLDRDALRRVPRLETQPLDPRGRDLVAVDLRRGIPVGTLPCRVPKPGDDASGFRYNLSG